MLKIAIIGCGKIADGHAAAVQTIGDCEIVGVCDREPLMAKQLSERFPIGHCFTSASELLDETRPDVVHITTPPEGHYEIAKECLQRGSHVYVEKPFTVYGWQAQALTDLAEKNGLKLTVGHNYQFTHVARRMRAVIESGYLGGPPVHMESHYCYDLGDPSYAKALLGDRNHWLRRLPGKLVQNVISHGIARIAEFLTSEDLSVMAFGFVSPLLREIGETDIVDELRVIICERERTTAYLTFSTQMKPAIHEFRVYGPKNGLILDQDHEILIRLRGKNFKSYAEKFIPSVSFAKQHIENLATNAKLFSRRDFHMESGLRYLIERFYRSIREDAPVPIPYREILISAKIMDAIVGQLANGGSHYQADFRASSGLHERMDSR
ncbi:MAG: Gfo/Idh/MocA family oxidoreductase [Candidatus Acidiferrales bacterium]